MLIYVYYFYILTYLYIDTYFIYNNAFLHTIIIFANNDQLTEKYIKKIEKAIIN